MQWVSVFWFCILWPCRIHLSVCYFLVKYLGFFLYSVIHPQIVKVLFLPYWFGCLLFLFVVWLLRPGSPILYWTTVVQWTSLLCSWPWGKSSQFSPLRVILAVGLSYMTFMIHQLLHNVFFLITVTKGTGFRSRWFFPGFRSKWFFSWIWEEHMGYFI